MNEVNVVDAKSLELLNKARLELSESTEDDTEAEKVGDALLDCVNWFYRDAYKAGNMDCYLFSQGTIDYYLQATANFIEWIEENYIDHPTAKSNIMARLDWMITNLSDMV